jgi:hypothetical protein
VSGCPPYGAGDCQPDVPPPTMTTVGETPPLPRTGSESGELLWTGSLMLTAGTVLLALSTGGYRLFQRWRDRTPGG